MVSHGAQDEAARAFCEREYPRLVTALAYRVGNSHVAEELAQEALLRACTRWERVGDLESPGGWAWRVARNLASSHVRRRQAERRAIHRHGPATGSYRDPDAADVLSVRSALTELPPRQRDVVVARHVLDLSVAETALRLGISSDAVRSLTKRGIATLREILMDRASTTGASQEFDHG